MSFIAAAVIGGGVALLGGYMSSQAAGDAADAQSGAANRATDAQLQMFNTQNQQQAPYRQAGYASLDALMRGLGIGGGKTYDGSGNVISSPGAMPAPTRQQFTKMPSNAWGNTLLKAAGLNPPTQGATFDQSGYDQALAAYNTQQNASAPPAGGAGASPGGVADGYFTHQFNANDLNDNLAPNYAFMRDQGLGAVRNAGNLQTGLLSGNTLKGINDYAMNYAGNAYQQAYNNYTANQTNIFNRLSNIAGLGQTANQATGQAATATGQGIASSLQNAGAAQAAGAVGQANAWSGAANNALGWYTLSQMNNGGNV